MSDQNDNRPTQNDDFKLQRYLKTRPKTHHADKEHSLEIFEYIRPDRTRIIASFGHHDLSEFGKQLLELGIITKNTQPRHTYLRPAPPMKRTLGFVETENRGTPATVLIIKKLLTHSHTTA